MNAHLMSLYRTALASMWIAWVAYWWLSSRWTKVDQRRESAGSRASHMIPLMIAAVLLSQPPLHVAGLGTRLLPFSPGVFFFGLAMVAIGLLFSVWARAHLGRNWSASVTVKQGHELVQSGPYRLVRHPIYTGLLLALLGTAVARGDAQGFLAVLIACVAVWRKLRIEEQWMQETFGDVYAGYRARVSALIPFVL
jgi:protein-S-isoprenylcysteine O-methyltransferase Ste14